MSTTTDVENLKKASSTTPTSDPGSAQATAQRPQTSDTSAPTAAGSRPRTSGEKAMQMAGKYTVKAAPLATPLGGGAVVATKAAGRLLLEGSGARPTDVAHGERAAYRQAKGQVAKEDRVAEAARNLKGGGAAPTQEQTRERMAEASTDDERAAAAREHMEAFLAQHRAENAGEKGTVTAGRLRARVQQTMAATKLGKAVEKQGHRAGYEGTMQESADLLGADLRRTPDGLSLSGSGPAPVAQAGGKEAQSKARFHRGIKATGEVLAGDNGKEDLLRGNTKTALAKGLGGLARDSALEHTGTAVAGHAGKYAGKAVTALGGAIAGGALRGIGSGIGYATGLESKAAHQDKVDAYDKHWNGGEDGVTRAQEIEERGFRPREQGNGFNDKEAGLPSVNYAKEGESWSEGRAKADQQGQTWKEGGVRGAATGLAMGMEGAARGAYSNAKGSIRKMGTDAVKLAKSKVQDAKNLAKKGLAGVKRAGTWLADKVGSKLTRPEVMPVPEDDRITY